jgi:hypothetical protein
LGIQQAAERFRKSDQRIAGDVDCLKEGVAGSLVKRQPAGRVVSEGDGMNEAVQNGGLGSYGVAKSINLWLVFNITYEDGVIWKKSANGFGAGIRADSEDQIGSGFLEHLCGVPGNTFAVGDADDENITASQLQKVHGAVISERERGVNVRESRREKPGKAHR